MTPMRNLFAFDCGTGVHLRIAAGGTRPGAQGGAVGAAHRLHCGARPEVAPYNSLRSLRSLRSNTSGESDNEARCARRLQSCAPRRPTIRPWPGTACRNATSGGVRRVARQHWFRKGAPGQAAARMRSAEEHRAFGRARSALRELTRCVCPTTVSEANGGSYATGQKPEHRKAVVAKRRPLRLSAAACPGAPLPHQDQPAESAGAKK